MIMALAGIRTPAAEFTFHIEYHYTTDPLNIDIDRSTNSITGHQYLTAINDSIISKIEDINIEQLVDFPTRKKNILDILFTNNPSFSTAVSDISGISDLDWIVLVDIIWHPCRNQSTSQKNSSFMESSRYPTNQKFTESGYQCIC